MVGSGGVLQVWQGANSITQGDIFSISIYLQRNIRIVLKDACTTCIKTNSLSFLQPVQPALGKVVPWPYPNPGWH